MKFGCLFAVEDIHAARNFYENLFGLTVSQDYGRMVGFDCGLILQQDFGWLTGIPEDQIKHEENNCELYFEVEDFDGFLQKLHTVANPLLLHDTVTCPWGQRVIRFYDLDNHLIEVGENMGAVARNFLAQGMSMEAVAEKMDVTVRDVQNMLDSLS